MVFLFLFFSSALQSIHSSSTVHLAPHSASFFQMFLQLTFYLRIFSHLDVKLILLCHFSYTSSPISFSHSPSGLPCWRGYPQIVYPSPLRGITIIIAFPHHHNALVSMIFKKYSKILRFFSSICLLRR